MRVYGWDDTGVVRGELRAVVADNDIVFNHPDELPGELGWERAFTSFKKAKAALIAAMVEQESAPELIATVRSYKASDCTGFPS